MGLGEYEDALKRFALLRVRPSTLADFGFRRKGKSGWEYVATVDGMSLERRVTISTNGKIGSKKLFGDDLGAIFDSLQTSRVFKARSLAGSERLRGDELFADTDSPPLRSQRAA